MTIEGSEVDKAFKVYIWIPKGNKKGRKRKYNYQGKKMHWKIHIIKETPNKNPLFLHVKENTCNGLQTRLLKKKKKKKSEFVTLNVKIVGIWGQKQLIHVFSYLGLVKSSKLY